MAGGVGAAGASGIKVSTDAGATWSSLTSGLAWPFVWPIATAPVAGNQVNVFVGSPGSGFYRTTLAGGGPVAVAEATRNPALRVTGFRPNPARGHIAVAFSLATAEPAALEVFDLAGRRLVRREVVGMGPGDHLIPLPAFAPGPGVYVIRLAQGDRSASASGVVVR
jgi:photosystem II stability/assembly factor-like uncharacterized protein